jgi:hypothetical protein
LSAQNLETFNNYNSIKDENSHEKKLLKKELQIEAVKAGIKIEYRFLEIDSDRIFLGW